MLVIGIDPGLSGALVFYDTETNKFEVEDMPVRVAKGKKVVLDGLKLAELVDHHRFPGETEVIIEEVHGRPRQAGVFGFGFSTGLVHGVIHTFGIPIHIVSPVKWKPAMGLFRQPGEGQAEYKDRSRLLAKALFPDSSAFDRKKDDGRAEALLLALYWAHKADKK